jgi:3-oxoadipate enol-lactonase
MLSNSLGCTLQVWEPQMNALTQLFRVIRYDRRGHGKSSAPPGPYSMERFGRDVLAILDGLNIEKVHWCGLSMGGMVGQWLGANASDRFGKIVLANTAYHLPGSDQLAQPYQGGERRRDRFGGRRCHRGLADGGLPRARTADHGNHERDAGCHSGTRLSRLLRGVEHTRPAWASAQLKSPTLVIAGRHDMATPVAAGEVIRGQIPGASLTILDAAHTSNVEQPHAFTDAVVGFLTQP